MNGRFIKLGDFGIEVIHEYTQQSHTSQSHKRESRGNGRSGTKNFKCGTPAKKMHSRKIAATPTEIDDCLMDFIDIPSGENNLNSSQNEIEAQLNVKIA